MKRARHWVWVWGLALGLGVSTGFSQGVISQILSNGPTAKRVNIVFFSEGYIASQAAQFDTDARGVLSNFLATAPFNAYPGYFNAFTIFTASLESGSDHPNSSIYKNTYFNSSYDSYGVARLITIPPNDRDSTYANGQGKIDSLLLSLMPEHDLTMLIVNDTAYGGSGGSTLMTSVNVSSRQIAVHEAGHTFSGLGDEYDDAYPGFPDTEEPNTTIQTDPALIKWRDWIPAGTPIPTPETSAYSTMVGLFEGAHYHATGWYRPKLDCKMKTLGAPFCEVCAETLVKSTYRLVRPIEAHSPATNSVITLAETESLALSITPLIPTGYALKKQWFTNNVAVTDATNADFALPGSGLSFGTNQVRVEVYDPTIRVRNDPTQLLFDSRVWRVNMLGSPVLDARAMPGQLILSWPATAMGFFLEGKTNFNASAPWTLLGGVPAIVEGRYTVTNLTTSNFRFFRLHHF